MKYNRLYESVLILVFVALFAIACLQFAAAIPTGLNNYTIEGNYSNDGQALNATMWNNSKGYIHIMDINEAQPTSRWKAYVGNISAQFALMDSSNNAIYNWTIGTIKGELYATRRAYATGSFDSVHWAGMDCASNAQMALEMTRLSHFYYDEDNVNATFKTWADDRSYSQNYSAFYAGPSAVPTNCKRIFLNGGTANDWAELALVDGTGLAGDVNDKEVIYTAILENRSVGFNGKSYDFQILLPETGLNGTPENLAYYFYIELV